MKCFILKEKKFSYRRETATHVFLGWVTDRSIYWTQKMF